MKLLNNKLNNHADCSRYLRVFFILVFYFLSVLGSYVVAAPKPDKEECAKNWKLDSVVSDMRFGSFTAEAAGTIELTGGSARSNSAGIDLLTGTAVNSHQIQIDNGFDPECNRYSIKLRWLTSPDDVPMQGSGLDIPISNTQVIIPGKGMQTLPYNFKPGSLPITVEVIATMSASAGQAADSYSSGDYEMELVRKGDTIKYRVQLKGKSESVAVTPLIITPGAAMNFGEIAAGSVTTTVSVNAAGAVTAPAGSGNALVTIVAGSPLTFNIQGDSGRAYNLNFVDGTLDNGSGNTMNVTITGDDRPILSGTSQTVTATGDLLVGANQPGGSYSTGTGSGVPIQVIVDYN